MIPRIKMISALTLAVLAFLTATTILIANRESTEPVRDADGVIVPGYIAVMDRVRIGGVEQALLIRGARTDAPILLWLHGGPGTPAIPFAREYNAALEREFLIVHWDQRGAGKSFYEADDLPDSRLRLRENFVADAIELSERLIRRFHGESPPAERKVILFGHGWGALLAVLAARERPDLFYSVVAAGLPVNMRENEIRSYDWALATARESGNEQAIRELETIGRPPYSSEERHAKVPTHWKWIMRQGGALFERTSLAGRLPVILWNDEYNLVDKVAFAEGANRILPAVWDEYMRVDLLRDAAALRVPVLMLHGRHDRQMDPELAREYFTRLRAPRKGWVWFESSAHAPMFAEPDRFHQVLREWHADTR